MIINYKIETAMGKVNTTLGHPLDFLTADEKKALDKIGHTGKLGDVKISREKYLNTLGYGEFAIVQTKHNNGEYVDEFIVSRYTEEKPKTNSKEYIIITLSSNRVISSGDEAEIAKDWKFCEGGERCYAIYKKVNNPDCLGY